MKYYRGDGPLDMPEVAFLFSASWVAGEGLLFREVMFDKLPYYSLLINPCSRLKDPEIFPRQHSMSKHNMVVP